MDKPLLILAFNRPQHLKRLIDSLRPHKPQKILVGIDGPRPGNPNDVEKVSAVLREVKNIDWTSDVELRIREKNLGLRFAVADAVTWAIEKYDEVIVVEDDIEVGPEFLDFMNAMVDRFRNDDRIGHISGFNMVPESMIQKPNIKIRLSWIPESYAWATWGRAWQNYDPSLKWTNWLSEKKLRHFVSGYLAALIWKINFRDAKDETINTWAYRWVASLWSSNQLCVSPNRNLIRYTGSEEGSHVFLKKNHDKQPIKSIKELQDTFDPQLDTKADLWLGKSAFGATIPGLFLRVSQSLILRFRKMI